MNKPKSGGPAFPCVTDVGFHGMGLRDWFAAQAMSKLVEKYVTVSSSDYVAKVSYSFADAMIAERDK